MLARSSGLLLRGMARARARERLRERARNRARRRAPEIGHVLYPGLPRSGHAVAASRCRAGLGMSRCESRAARRGHWSQRARDYSSARRAGLSESWPSIARGRRSGTLCARSRAAVVASSTSRPDRRQAASRHSAAAERRDNGPSYQYATGRSSGTSIASAFATSRSATAVAAPRLRKSRPRHVRGASHNRGRTCAPS